MEKENENSRLFKKKFEDNFPFIPSEDQLKAIQNLQRAFNTFNRELRS
jgi:transcription-repair coupling factor (superfamily II helicase)